jgi:hypothetical protein
MVGLCTRPAIERAGTVTPHLQRGAPDFYPNAKTVNLPEDILDHFLEFGRSPESLPIDRAKPIKYNPSLNLHQSLNRGGLEV